MEKLAKGNIIVATRRFLDIELEAAQRDAVLARVAPQSLEAARSAERGKWYPRETACALWRGIHQSANSDEEALALLDRCGHAIGNDATNSFLRLLVRLLTPAVFAKKFPRIWTKDFDFGQIKTKLREHTLEIRASDVEGFDYFVFTASGWFTHAMTMMGCKNVVVTHDATLDNPGPAELNFVLRWE